LPRRHAACLKGSSRPISPGVGARLMGKYFLGWLLGVPAIVLVIVYFFFR
jgi:hypothetical protein